MDGLESLRSHWPIVRPAPLGRHRWRPQFGTIMEPTRLRIACELTAYLGSFLLVSAAVYWIASR